MVLGGVVLPGNWETGVYCSLLLAAWRRYDRNMVEAPTSSWRTYCGKAALILAICSMLLELVFILFLVSQRW